jgi:cysteine-rich repeat protein
VIVLAGAAAGCIDPGLVQCDNGLVCPVTQRCDDLHRSCVIPEQLVACDGAADGADCTAGPVSGGCFDRVCLPRGCGNRVVEPGEMCDDGNQITGDGCSGDCRSTERCGNGFVDPDEPCDDGNLASRDGCDSQCKVETAAWSEVIAIAPRYTDARVTAYDAARGRLVYGAPGETWEWDGTRWTFSPPSIDQGFASDALYYDPDRGRVCMIAVDITGIARLHAWTDGRWQLVDAGNGPPLDGFPPQLTVAYDTARHRAMVIQFATGAVWTIDATGTWAEQPSMPEIPGDSVAVFDAASSEIVVETAASIEWVHDGMGWTSSPTDFSALVSLAFDPARGRVVLVDNVARTTHERIGAAWSTVDNGDVPCVNEDMFLALPLYYDARAETLSVFSSGAGELCRWNQAWTVTAPPLPFSPVGVTFDPVSRSFVVLHNPHPSDPDSPTQTWRLGLGGWQRIETLESPYGRSSPLAVYAPGRGATVLYGEETVAPIDNGPLVSCGDPVDYAADSWSFDGANWSAVASFARTGPPCSSNAATYDATHGRVVVATYNEVWSLGDTDHAWQRIAAPTSGGHVFNLAWDARNAGLMAARLVQDVSSPLFELHGDDWTPIEIIPTGLNSSTNALASDLRAGTVIVLENGFGRAWERAGADWLRLPSAPITGMFVAWTAYDPITGRLFYLGRKDSGTFAAILTRTSATPFESCRAGADDDGDGLAGCDDPDCVWTCR